MRSESTCDRVQESRLDNALDVTLQAQRLYRSDGQKAQKPVCRGSRLCRTGCSGSHPLSVVSRRDGPVRFKALKTWQTDLEPLQLTTLGRRLCNNRFPRRACGPVCSSSLFSETDPALTLAPPPEL